jgi:hypothetical protein
MTLFLIEDQVIEDTITINLPFPLIITSGGYGQVKLIAHPDLLGKPMFSVKSDIGFNKLLLNGQEIEATYGEHDGENAIELDEEGIYVEYKDCALSGFYNGIKMNKDCEVWAMDAVVANCLNNGVSIVAEGEATFNPTYRSIAVDYSNSLTSINLSKGKSIIFTSQNDQCMQKDSRHCFIEKSETVTFDQFLLMGINWNHGGIFKSGFDFSLTSGRDADIEMTANVGQEDQNPHASISVSSSTAVTQLLSQTWTKAIYNTNYVYVKKFSFSDNRYTFLSSHERDTRM